MEVPATSWVLQLKTSCVCVNLRLRGSDANLVRLVFTYMYNYVHFALLMQALLFAECADGFSPCVSVPECIENSAVCHGTAFCSDFSDELNCGNFDFEAQTILASTLMSNSSAGELWTANITAEEIQLITQKLLISGYPEARAATEPLEELRVTNVYDKKPENMSKFLSSISDFLLLLLFLVLNSTLRRSNSIFLSCIPLFSSPNHQNFWSTT